jgi:hypothetical protein
LGIIRTRIMPRTGRNVIHERIPTPRKAITVVSFVR